jgi:NTE family protein
MSSSTGMVLAGAAALGAYEVGVVSHVSERVLPETGAKIDVLSGTSAGAINAAALAAFADRPELATRLLAKTWRELELGQVLRPSSVEMLSMMLDVSGFPGRWWRALRVRAIRGGLLDPRGVTRLVQKIPLGSIEQHVRAGRVRIAIPATRIANGASVVFYAARGVEPWASEPNVVPVAAHLTEQHVLASAAIPLLFPPVSIDGELYCDGGLRQMVPLSPAVHLGADRLLVINPLSAVREPTRSPAVTSPLYLAGKALNSLFADRVVADVAQLRHTTAIIRAGRRRYGPTFERELDRQLARDGESKLREIDSLCIEPSRDLGAMAAAHVRGRAFAARATGAAGRLLRCMADGDPDRAGDLLAYVLFDGGFTSELVELGRADANARHAELVALFEGRPTASLARG